MFNLRTMTKFWLGFDKHNPNNDSLVDEIVTEFLADFKPHIRVAGGDWNSCDQVNPFNNEHQADVEPELEQTHRDLVRWKITDWMEGNHDERLRRVGGKVVQGVRSLLDIQKHLKLAELKIRAYPYHPTEGILRIGSLKVLHGWYCNEYFARKTAEVYGTCVCGHAHRFQEFQPRSAFDTRVGFGVGMLGSLKQPYNQDRAPMGWAQGFAFGYVHRNGWFDLYRVRINAGRVCINGKVYGTFQEEQNTASLR